jgi:quinoprotein glucose dehydrogenase
LKPKGASFELTGARKFLEGVLATDCDFGPDGGLYLTDWIDGWNGTGKGRIYRVVNPSATNDPRVKEVQKLLTNDFSKLPTDELVKLLAHADRRARLEAQFALVERRAIDDLAQVATHGNELMSRLHAIGGLAQIARKPGFEAADLETRVATLVDDPNEHVRAQVVRLIGETGGSSVGKLRMSILDDKSLHVRHLAAIAAGKQVKHFNIPYLIGLLKAPAGNDPVIRHAVAFALSKVEPSVLLTTFLSDESISVRMGILLGWRRTGDPKIGRLLQEADSGLVLEAARAIHDMPIDDIMPELAEKIGKPYTGSADQYDALFRRVLNANFRLGKPEHAEEIARYAARKDAPENLRIEALDMLASWAKPSPRDRVLGSWRPLAQRDGAVAAAALRGQLAPIFSGSAAVRRKAAEVASKLGVKEVVPELVRLMQDSNADAPARAAALAALGQLNAGGLDETVKSALADTAPELRIEGRRILARRNPAGAIKELKQAFVDGTQQEKQAAIETIATIPEPPADEALGEMFDQLTADRLAPELRLDLVNAVRDRLSRPNRLLTWPAREALREQLKKHDESLAKDPSIGYQMALAGGDAERGRRVFFEKTALSCVRCHKISDAGGEVGPDLTKIGADKNREYLLESLVDPNKTIAKGFETVVLTLDDGRPLSGIVKSENAKELTLITPEAKTVTVPTAEILERTTGQSAMPADLPKQVTLAELRDLVEFLSSLR